MARVPRPEVQAFIQINKEEKAAGKKMPWKDRYALILEHFPIADRLDWKEALRDVDLYGRVLKDILRMDQANEEWAGPGPRPVLDQQRARERLRQFMGDDYSYLPFREAFDVLAGDRSIRHLANKIGFGAHNTWNLKNGHKEPDLYTLEVIAKAFNKDPSYFVEYRIAYVLGALGDQMSTNPEMTVDLYRKLRGKNK